ncbi:MAG: dihydroneopterin aldolase [Rikenellaceae bacterium]
MKEIIEIEKMEFYSFHGCFEAEKIVGNRFELYLKATCSAEKAMISDEVSDTVSYLDLYGTIKKEMAIPSNILENVGYRILTAIKKEYPAIETCQIKISKMNPPLGGSIERVSVSMGY